jgi:NADPH2:quinone reductase
VAALVQGGGYAEYSLARAGHTIRLPEAVSLEVGAAFPLQAFTAFHALTTLGRLAPGETVVIHAAAGGVGTLSIQLAKLFGAGRVIATAGGAEKLRLAWALGADEAIDYLRENFPARVNELTACRGAELILDSVGGQILERSFECLSVLGRVITFGNASGSQADLNSLWNRIRNKSQALIGFNISAALDRPSLRDPSFAALLEYLVDGRLKVIIGECYDLEDAAAAQAELENRRSTGKILLRVQGAG